MVKYMDLSDQQLENLFKFLDKANSPQLNIIKENFTSLKPGFNNIQYRDNVLHALMTEEVNFNFFMVWTAHLFLNTSNTIYVFDIDKKQNISVFQEQTFLSRLLEKVKFIFDYNPDTLNDIELINIKHIRDKNQILFSFISPAQVIKNKQNGTQFTIEKDIYFSYIWLDINFKKLIISIPPHPNYFSVNGYQIKKNDSDKIAMQFLNYFEKKIKKLKFIEPKWIIPVLNEINREYFHHNNPLITKKLDNFLNNNVELALKLVDRFDKLIVNDFSKNRIIKNLTEIIENELIIAYGAIKKETPFSIFLQELDKGLTQYRANNGGNAFSFADSREILKKMIENAHISAIGLMYNYNERNISYKIYKSNYFFALKRTSTATTDKEIVDSVLYELNKYKQRIETKYLREEVAGDR